MSTTNDTAPFFMNDADQAAYIAYRKAKSAGKSPRRAHTAAMDAAAKVLGKVEGSWDVATRVQDYIEADNRSLIRILPRRMP